LQGRRLHAQRPTRASAWLRSVVSRTGWRASHQRTADQPAYRHWQSRSHCGHPLPQARRCSPVAPACRGIHRLPVEVGANSPKGGEGIGTLIPRSPSARLSAAHQQNRLDLQRHPVRQRSHADRGAGVAAGLAEHIDQEVGAAVDDLGMVGEISKENDPMPWPRSNSIPRSRAARTAGITWPSRVTGESGKGWVSPGGLGPKAVAQGLQEVPSIFAGRPHIIGP
jgi:hypothetical protein